MYRFRKTEVKYNKHKVKHTTCAFCDPDQRAKTIRETEHLLLIENRFPYDIWEGHRVIEHVLLIPKRHVAHFGEMNSPELAEVMQFIQEFESNDYNVYARAKLSAKRSIAAHQHTHFIKTDNEDKKVQGVFYLEKPYIVARF